ncbi:probable ubiquitin-conjugating enzyme E2 23 [Aegilops tauschii subsp. strangulata]|uniref:probable ubiquitin-conjugating enzyme E2 23 n=1 Tax=Aegilops tauschii subsp. strangulata TaxID=200361 RepID=UPI003CC8A8AA
MDVVPAAESPNLYFLDLVSSGPMLIDRGLVLPVGEVDNHYLPVDKFELLRIDDSVVYKNISDIKVVDRSHLYPGQLVGSASDMGGQIGVITGVNTMLNLAKLDNKGLPIKVIRGVSPSSLRRIRSLNLGDFVVSGPWLGRVVEVSIDIDVLFDDGAVCRVSDAESKNLVGVRENRHSRRRCQMNSIFHQGLSVGGPDACSIFKAARWLNGYWHPQRDLGTIMKLETSGVLVYWVASMHYGTDKELLEASAPPAYQNPDDLTFFCASYDCSTSVNNNIAASGTGPTEHVGIVKSMQYEHQTVCVSWFKTPGHPDEAREVECDDIVSAYDLRLDSNHSAYYGDIVIRILPSVSTDGGESAPLLQGNKKKNAVPADLSWVGRVVELPNGHVQVKWGDGSMSTVSPHEIVVVKDENYMELWLEMGDWVEDDGIDDAPEEPVAANTAPN